jgi:hypothetical protein
MIKNKPIARWTLGPCSRFGIISIKKSIKEFSKIYPKFERIVCYNNVERPKGMDADLLEQKLPYNFSIRNYKIGSSRLNSGWKLCPARININCHELWIDNDFILYKKNKHIDDWINGDYSIITEGIGRNFGIFDKFIDNKLKICAGFFGLPPNFNFDQHIVDAFNKLNIKEIGGWDEQGLVSYIVTGNKHVVIPFSILPISTKIKINKKTINEYDGIHFVGINRKEDVREFKNFCNLYFKFFL